MIKPYYQDDTITLLHGDALEQAQTLPYASVDCIVTSPPYYGLRDYGQDGQYGAEGSAAEYVETLRALFSELRRVLAEDGTFWLNLGDTYSKKELLGVPWRVALALQEDGWKLRSDIIWNKRDAMPESVKDRPSRRHEHIFLFTKNRMHHFDLDAIREPHTTFETHGKFTRPRNERPKNGAEKIGPGISSCMGYDAKGKNPGDVWSLTKSRYKGAHFAVFPTTIPERAILAGCKPGGTVLDPFSGSGTTGMVAKELGRKYVGIDINADYLNLSLETRLQDSEIEIGEAA